jgi:hypothetical protein
MEENTCGAAEDITFTLPRRRNKADKITGKEIEIEILPIQQTILQGYRYTDLSNFFSVFLGWSVIQILSNDESSRLCTSDAIHPQNVN